MMRSPRVNLQILLLFVYLVVAFSCELLGRHSISISGVAKIILRTQTKLSLTCMAAKAIKTYNLPYRGNVPRSLESFIELHGPGLNQS